MEMSDQEMGRPENETNGDTTPESEVDALSSERGPAAFLNWRAARSGVPWQQEREYPLFSDAEISGGTFDPGKNRPVNAQPLSSVPADDVAKDTDSSWVGPYRFINTLRDSGARVPNRHRPALVIAVRLHYELPIQPPDWARTDYSSYHGGRIEDELAALLSLLVGIRIKAGGESRYGASPVAWSAKPDPLLPEPTAYPMLPRTRGTHALGDLRELASFPNLMPDDATALVRAARLYQEAIWISDSAPELSWLMFVSAVEAAAVRWAETEQEAAGSPLDWLRSWRSRLAHRLVRDGSQELAEWVAGQLQRVTGSTGKFVGFIMTFQPAPPPEWERPPEPGTEPRDPDTGEPRSDRGLRFRWDEIESAAERIYDYRSKALHEGTPFPAPMCEPPYRVDDVYAEVPPGLATSSHGAVWLADDLPMLLHTWEYVARGVLLEWWRSLVPR